MKEWNLIFTDRQLEILAVALGAARSMFEKYPQYEEMLHKPVNGEDIHLLHKEIKNQLEKSEMQ